MGAKHHTVPQFYLRNFADDSGKIALVARDDLRRHVTSVRNAAAETGFYRIEKSDLVRAADRAAFDPESVEAAISAVEGEIAPAVSVLVEGRFGEISPEVWYRLIQLVALQTVRGHRWRNDLTAHATQVMRIETLERLTPDRAAEVLAQQGRPNDPASVAVFLEGLMKRFPTVVPPKAVMVQESLRMALGDGVSDLGLGEFLAPKKLELLLPDHERALTSDEPVVWWSPGDEPVGYDNAEVVWLPLSPVVVLQLRNPSFDFVTNGLPDPTVRSSQDELVRFVNSLVAAQAERWIMHHPRTDPLRDVVLPECEVWGDELVEIIEEGDVRREVYRHRRLPPGARRRS